VEEDFIHENPSSTSNIQEDFITTDPSENDFVADPHIDETPISVEQGQSSTVTCSKNCAEYYQHLFARTIYYK
jgi:hypothetical protein